MALCWPLAVQNLFNCLLTNYLPSFSYIRVTVMTIQLNFFNTDTKGTEPSVRFYRGVRIIEVGNVGFLAFLGPNELSVIERCPYYKGFRKERFDCILFRQCLIYMWSKALCTGRPNFAIYMLIKQVCFNTLKNDIFIPVVPSSTTQVWQLTTEK